MNVRRLLAAPEGKSPKLRTATLAMFLLLESASCSGSGNMEQMGKEKTNPPNNVAGLVIAKTSPLDKCMTAIKSGNLEAAKKPTFEFLAGNAKKEERKAVFDAFAAKFGPSEAVTAAFEFLRESNAPKQQKYQIMDLLVDKYGKGMLQFIYVRAMLDFGMDYNITSEELPKKYPEKLSYMQTLGYGLCKFGAEGFAVAELIVFNMDKTRVFDLPLFSNRDNPLSEMLVCIVCVKLAREGAIDPQKTIDYLVAKYLLNKDGNPVPDKYRNLPGFDAPGQSLETKGVVLSMIDLIAENSGKLDKAKVLRDLLAIPGLDEDARLLIEEGRNTGKPGEKR